VARCCDPVPKDRIYVTARKSQQTRQRPISDLFSPVAEQMKDEEERCRLCPSGRCQREVVFDLFEEQWDHLAALGGCSPQGFFRKALGVGQFVEDCPCIHRDRLP